MNNRYLLVQSKRNSILGKTATERK